MSNRTLPLGDDLYHYLLSVSLRETPLLRELRQETARLPQAGMQIAPEQGQFMAWLVGVMGARRCLEIGVFTGYSTLWTAAALPEDGAVVACDLSPEWTAIARRYWERAGVAHKIALHLGAARDTLQQLLQQGQQGSFDYAFIDADKKGYREYYELCLRLVRPGGVILIDNMLWHGRVLEEAAQDADTVAIRRLNQELHEDARVHLSLLPLGDGLALLRKLGG